MGFSRRCWGTGLVFGIKATKALAFGKGEPFSQTRYCFDLPD
jgi:hypothetical protein